MIPDPDVFRINAVPFSWNSLLFFIDGIPRRRVTACSFEEKIERGKVKNANRAGVILGLTSGEYSVDGVSLTVLPDEELWLRSYLNDKGGLEGAGKAFFTMQIQLSEDDMTITHDFAGCKLGGGKFDSAVGVEGSVKVCAVDCISMTVGGLPLYDVGRLIL